MLAVTLLAFLAQSQSICTDATVSGILTGAETSCPGARACFDGCKYCNAGKKLCDVMVAETVADPSCACDFWMCYAYCAKANCESALQGSAAGYCAVTYPASAPSCAVNCAGAWMLSAAVPLLLLALFQ